MVGLWCGSQHSLVLTVEGKLYSWGRNLEGQLGKELIEKFKHKECMYKKIKITKIKKQLYD